MQALRRRGRALHRPADERDAAPAQGLGGRGRQARQGVSVHELLPDHGLRQRPRLDLASRGPPPRPHDRLQQVPGRIHDARHRRAVGERLRLRSEMRRAFRFVVKRVFSSYNLAAAHHARNLLEVEGIRAVVRNELLSSAMGELPPAECQIEVWVMREEDAERAELVLTLGDRKSTRLNSSHQIISYAVFCLKKKKKDYKSRQEP